MTNQVVDSATVSDWWDAALASEVTRIGEANPGWSVEDWRTAGRATKAKPHGEDLAWWSEDGLIQVQAYAEWLARSGWQIAALPDGSPAVEFRMAPTFAGREIKMFVDAAYEVAGQVVLVDYKSGSSTPDSAAQLGLYAASMAQTFGIDVPVGAYYLSRKAALTDPLPLTHYTQDYWDKTFAQFFAAMDNRIFLPNLQRHCSFCSVAPMCAAKNGERAPEFDPLAGALADYDVPAHASYSQLTSWTRCGKAFELERLRKVPSRPSVWLAGGSAVHTVIEQINRASFEAAQNRGM